ncbi:MAG: short-chain dehydrogenase/reductase [Cryobacterium sp.]|jgi:ribitol 2-dehydrogenase|nr:short-chain dehydrogenase/reductase [Cryobacterium sp.]
MADQPTTAGVLAGKVAIVTGASSGIGLATTVALADEGCSVLAVGRSQARLTELLGDGSRPIETLVADVADPSSAERIVAAALERFGRIDIVLPNAGIYAGGDLTQTPIDAIADVVATNVTGVFTLVRAALPHLIEQGHGDVLVTSSVAGHQDIHWEPVYSATKHAVQSFVHTVRRQNAGTGVRVGAIAPGVVLNPLWGFEHGSPEEQARIDEGTGIRSSDVAEAILFMLTRPPHVVVRDLVLLPTGQEI